jgi:hypothetical protein
MKTRFVLALAVLLAGCGPASPEKQNREAAEKVIRMLDKYRENSGAYPARLEDMDFGSDRAAVEARHYNYFRKTDDSYSLQFFFVDKGSQSCTYESAGRSWSCGPG